MDKPDDPDGTEINASASLHNVAFWRRHPDVIDVEWEHQGPTGGHLRLHLRSRPMISDEEYFAQEDHPTSRKPEPSRGCDIQLGGKGPPHSTFWDRVPGVEHMVLLVEPMPEPPDNPDGWWAINLWLTPTH